MKYQLLLFLFLLILSNVVKAEFDKKNECRYEITDTDKHTSSVLANAANILCEKWKSNFKEMSLEVLNIQSPSMFGSDINNLAYETGELKNGRVWVRISGELSKQKRKSIIWFRVKGYIDAWTVKHDIAEGIILRKGDFTRNLKEVTAINLVSDQIVDEPEGMYTRRPLRKGSVISTENVSDPPLIARNQNVQVVVKSNGLQIIAKAVSLSSGWNVGDAIVILVNGASERTEAIVADKGWAYVSN